MTAGSSARPAEYAVNAPSIASIARQIEGELLLKLIGLLV
jgi:hypothetical protein